MKKQDAIIESHLCVERALSELRRQMGVIITDKFYSYGVFPFEFITAAQLKILKKAPGILSLLLTSARARSMGMGFADPIAIVEIKTLTLSDLKALADPFGGRMKSRFSNTGTFGTEKLVVDLVKYTSLLPAVFLLRREKKTASFADIAPGMVKLTAQDMLTYIKKPVIDVVATASAKLPVAGMENSRITSFRVRYGDAVHLALVTGDITKIKSPLVRIHSSCVTGDILGSLRCDCGDQLKMAQAHIAKEGAGILLYLQQEGRGIGITNKIRAYQLQEQGYNTYDANLLLGFEEDERDFSVAAMMLKKLGAKRIRLMTNNPNKIDALKKHGIVIDKRVSLVAAPGKHNHGYLTAKSKRHLL